MVDSSAEEQAGSPGLFSPWLRAAAGVWLLLVVVVSQSLRAQISDPDLWWHLKTGALIAATHHVPRQDPFSYSAAGQPWTAHEWLSELVFYWIWRAWGFGGILWFRSLMLAAIVATVYFVLLRRCRSFPVSILLSVGVVVATSSFWSERPQLFTYLLLALLIGALDLAAAGLRGLLWAIPPAMIVWANLHGGYFSALLVMGAVLAGSFLDSRLGPDPGRHCRALLKPLLVVLVLSAAAACLNPQGPGILLYPLRYLTEKGLSMFVLEWQAPNANQPLGMVFEALLLTFTLIGVSSRLHWPWRDVVPFILFAHLGFTAMRHVPIFALIAVTAFAGTWPEMASTLLRAIHSHRWANSAWDQITRQQNEPGAGTDTAGTRLVSIAVVVSGLVICGVMAPKRNSFESTVKLKDIPYDAARWLQANVPPGKIFNYYDYGGYLIYLPQQGTDVDALPPPYRVLIDGRADVYGGTFVRELEKQINQAGPRWREWLDSKYRADIVFWPQRFPLTRLLEAYPEEWEKVYPPPGSRDKEVAIFRRRRGA